MIPAGGDQWWRLINFYHCSIISILLSTHHCQEPTSNPAAWILLKLSLQHLVLSSFIFFTFECLSLTNYLHIIVAPPKSRILFLQLLLLKSCLTSCNKYVDKKYFVKKYLAERFFPRNKSRILFLLLLLLLLKSSSSRRLLLEELLRPPLQFSPNCPPVTS